MQKQCFQQSLNSEENRLIKFAAKLFCKTEDFWVDWGALSNDQPSTTVLPSGNADIVFGLIWFGFTVLIKGLPTLAVLLCSVQTKEAFS